MSESDPSTKLWCCTHLCKAPPRAGEDHFHTQKAPPVLLSVQSPLRTDCWPGFYHVMLASPARMLRLAGLIFKALPLVPLVPYSAFETHHLLWCYYYFVSSHWVVLDQIGLGAGQPHTLSPLPFLPPSLSSPHCEHSWATWTGFCFSLVNS